MAQDEDSLDVVDQLATQDRLVIGESVVPGPGARGGFGQQRPSALLCQLAGERSGAVPGHDDRPGRHYQRRRYSREGAHLTGHQRLRLPRPVGHERVAKTHVEVHWARIGAQRPSRGCYSPQNECVEAFVGGESGRYVSAETWRGPEDPGLDSRLVSPRVPHLGGTVGRKDDERHPGSVGLEDGRVHVGHRGARGRDYRSRAASAAQP